MSEDNRENNLEGSIVLERLAEVGLVDDFLEAVDDDNFGKAKSLMESVDLDSEVIAQVIEEMKDANSHF